MGAATSRAQGAESTSTSGQEKMQQLNRTLLNKIEHPAGGKDEKTSSNGVTSTETNGDSKVPSLPRQQYLDSSVQGKIRQELSHLRKQEADVQRQIEQALEKETLDRASQARGGRGSGDGAGAKGKSSILLKQELDDVRSKIERHTQRRLKVNQTPGVKDSRKQLIECYNAHAAQPLECWQEVRNFRQAVARAESDFVASLSS